MGGRAGVIVAAAITFTAAAAVVSITAAMAGVITGVLVIF
jgi:hypothetical protein